MNQQIQTEEGGGKDQKKISMPFSGWSWKSEQMRNEQRKEILEGNIEEIVTKPQPSSFLTNRVFFLIKRYQIPSLSFLPVFQININGLFSYDQNA